MTRILRYLAVAEPATKYSNGALRPCERMC